MRLSFAIAFGPGALLLAVLLAGPGLAAEQTLRNDSAPPGTPCNCFLPGESTAAWLTSTCNGDIVAVQVLWASQVGGAPDQIEQSIRVLAAGTFPTPGATLTSQGGQPAVVLGPQLSDGVVNEFRFLDPPTDSMPLRVPVTSGQEFVVALQYQNQTSGTQPFGPDVVFDGDGCQSGRNANDVLPGGWSDSCPLGVTGDWAIRAVVDCSDPVVPATTPWSVAAMAGMLVSLGALVLLLRRRSGQGTS